MSTTFGNRKGLQQRIVDLVRENFVMTPARIIESLKLRRPIFKKTAAYGHFGRTEPEFTWEATDKAETCANAAGVGARRSRSRYRTTDPFSSTDFGLCLFVCGPRTARCLASLPRVGCMRRRRWLRCGALGVDDLITRVTSPDNARKRKHARSEDNAR